MTCSWMQIVPNKMLQKYFFFHKMQYLFVFYFIYLFMYFQMQYLHILEGISMWCMCAYVVPAY